MSEALSEMPGAPNPFFSITVYSICFSPKHFGGSGRSKFFLLLCPSSPLFSRFPQILPRRILSVIFLDCPHFYPRVARAVVSDPDSGSGVLVWFWLELNLVFGFKKTLSPRPLGRVSRRLWAPHSGGGDP